MLISVIIPVYNVETTLERATNSVLNQKDVEDFEVILVNDGSTDSSGSICDELAERDRRIRVIHKENGGLSSARNKGIEAAEGEFLAFLDSDDYYEPTILASFKNELLMNPDLDMYRFNVVRVNNGINSKQASINNVSNDVIKNVASLFDYRGIDFYAWNKIYRRNLFTTIKYPEGKLYEDIMTTYYTTKQARKIITTEEVGIYYISNSSSIVAAKFNPKQYDNVSERIKLLQEIQDDFPTLTEKALDKVVDGFLSTGYKISTSKKSEVTVEYYQKLKKDIMDYLPQVSSSQEVSKLKVLALRLLMWNIKAYGWLYKKYLRK